MIPLSVALALVATALTGGAAGLLPFAAIEVLLAFALIALTGTFIELRRNKYLPLTTHVFESSSNGILITDARNTILMVNPAFCRITGYSPEEVIGRTPRILSSGRHDRAFYDQLWRALENEGVWQGEIWNRRKDGQVYAEWLTINVVKDWRGRVTHRIAVFSDITQRKTESDRVQHMATHDALTGLPNRTLLAELLHKALADARRHGRRVAVLFLDLDRFKMVNDTLGHHAGDLLLQAVAQRLQASLRAGDAVARQGGDEFIMVLSEVNGIQDAAAVAEKVIAAVSQPYDLSGNEFFTSTSIGIAIFPEDGEDADSLLKNADAALYRAKDAGRNNFQFFAAEMNADAVERLALETGLRHALERNELILHYQPQIDLERGAVRGVEALLRWQSPERGLVPPTKFIPVAEESGLIHPIGAWVLTQACRDAKSWLDAGLPLASVAVNVSAVQLRHAGFATAVEAALEASGLPAEHLELEVTESLLMHDMQRVCGVMHALRSRGVKFAIDDFGTGYSSLSYLKRLPLDRLKLDQSFVRNLPHDDDAAIAATILAIGESLGLTIVAEGVESSAQHAWLQAHHCPLAQGYFFAKPMPASEMRAFMQARQTR